MNPWWALGLTAVAIAGYLLGQAAGLRRYGRLPGTLRVPAEQLIRAAVALGFVATATDVGSSRNTEAVGIDMERVRYWMQEQWQRSAEERRRLSAVLSGLTEGILLIDRYGRVLLVNEVAEGLWPRLRPTLRGWHQIELFQDAGLDRALSVALRAGRAQRVDMERPGPPRRFWRVRVLPLGSEPPAGPTSAAAPQGDGLPDGALVVVQDITEYRAAEQVRRDFVANVSHELQTPLTSVRGYAETLREGDLSAEECSRFTGHILREAERMAVLVRDLLALAQLEAPRWAPSEPVHIEEIVRDVVAAQGAFARQRGIQLEVQAEEAVAAGRPEELQRALDNLVRNALAYTARGGRVTVFSRCVGGNAVVDVQDTGIGIAADALPRIFERFYRVDRGRSRDTGGTGLGLAIVKHTAEGHGGRVEVRSEPGKGSTFSLVLPAAPGGAGPEHQTTLKP